MVIAESIRMAIAALEIPHKTSEVSDVIPLSLGVASVIPSGDQNVEILISQADQALYFAKSQGRNQVVFLG